VTDSGQTQRSTAARTGARDSRTFTASLRAAALDTRRGVVRLHPQTLRDLGLRSGDPVRLRGRRHSAAIVAAAAPADSPHLLYADDLILGNLGVREGAQVEVEPIPATPARRLLVDGPAEIAALVSPELLRLALLGKAVCARDNVSLLPVEHQPNQQARSAVETARRSLSNLMKYAWTSTLLTVVAVEPDDAAVVDLTTSVGWQRCRAKRRTNRSRSGGSEAGLLCNASG
jgi:transitional endoplasmic reticulum ATPase